MTQDQGTLDLRLASVAEDAITPFTGRCALEDDDFPFEAISDVASVECCSACNFGELYTKVTSGSGNALAYLDLGGFPSEAATAAGLRAFR